MPPTTTTGPNYGAGAGTPANPGTVGIGGPDPTQYGVSPNQGAYQIPMRGGVGDLAGIQPGVLPSDIPGTTGGPLPTGPQGAGQITLQELLAEFWRLPQAVQIQIENQLWAAGFYEDAAGNPLKKAPLFGTQAAAADTTKALINAATQAANTGVPLTTVIQQAAAQGVGAQQQQTNIFKPGVVAHGYRNVIDLRNPNDVRYAVEQMSEKFLGHKASEEDMNAVIQTIQSQDFADGMAKYNAQEQMSQLDFQAQVANRDAAVAYATGYQQPVGSGGAAGTAGAAGAGGASGSPQTQAMQFFISKGLPPAAAAGIVGNLQQESNINAMAPGGGIAQWQGTRWQDLVKMATAQGTSPNDLVTQLNFLWQELQTKYPDALTALKQASDPANAAVAFQNLFEKPGVPMQNNRIQYAEQALASGGYGPTPAPGTTIPGVGPSGTAIASNPPVTTQGPTAGGGGTAGTAGSFIGAAESQIGVPYQWGGESPGQNFDCSGLVQWAMKTSSGIDPGRTTYDQMASPKGAPVDTLSNAQPGDLLFFNWSGGSSPDHVAIYLGNGQMLDADHTGDTIGIRKSVPVGNIVGIRRFGVGGGQSTTNIVGGNDVYVPGSNTIMTQPGSPDAEQFARMSNPSPANPDYPDFLAHTAAANYGTMLGIIKSGGTQAPTAGVGQ